MERERVGALEGGVRFVEIAWSGIIFIVVPLDSKVDDYFEIVIYFTR